MDLLAPNLLTSEQLVIIIEEVIEVLFFAELYYSKHP